MKYEFDCSLLDGSWPFRGLLSPISDSQFAPPLRREFGSVHEPLSDERLDFKANQFLDKRS